MGCVYAELWNVLCFIQVLKIIKISDGPLFYSSLEIKNVLHYNSIRLCSVCACLSTCQV